MTATSTTTELERDAELWIAHYWNANHLRKTRDWLLRLDGDAPLALRIAALVHDCERMFPGGPRLDPSAPHDDERYLREHSERSARYATDWLRRKTADDALVAEVAELVRLHEVGGAARADLLQAADSISFLDVNVRVVVDWISERRATPAQARGKLDYMLQRIRVPQARTLALPLYERAVERLERDS